MSGRRKEASGKWYGAGNNARVNEKVTKRFKQEITINKQGRSLVTKRFRQEITINQSNRNAIAAA